MEQIDIDPQGDIRLVATREGGQHVGFLVNSQVPSLASKVFKVLLHGPFLEGRTREERSHAVQDVPLPDDFPTGLALLLEYLQFCPRPPAVQLKDLIALAVVVDKYQCVDVFKSQAEVWMSLNLNGQGVASDLAEYLGLAMAFRSAKLFHDVCIGLMVGGKESGSVQSVPIRVRKNLIVLAKSVVHHNITRSVASLLEPLLGKPDGGYYYEHSDDVPCRHDEVTISSYYRKCRTHCVLSAETWPTTTPTVISPSTAMMNLARLATSFATVIQN